MIRLTAIMSAILCALGILLATMTAVAQERKVPKDSVELAVQGCLDGRVLAVTEPSEAHGPVRGPNVTGRSFRVNGRRAVIDTVKRHHGHLVEVVGLARITDIAQRRPGMTLGGGTRILIGPPAISNDPNRPPTPGPGLPVLDVTSVRFLSDACPLFKP